MSLLLAKRSVSGITANLAWTEESDVWLITAFLVIEAELAWTEDDDVWAIAGTVTQAAQATPGRRLYPLEARRGETEEEKYARRVREGTIKPKKVVIEGNDLAKESAALVIAIAKARADADAAREAIQALKAMRLEAEVQRVSRDLLRAEQALQLALVREAAMVEELEIVNIAFLAVAALEMTQ